MGWMSKIRNRDEGASLVEFAFVLPFLLLLILGVIEFGWLLGLNNYVRHGEREGARFASVNGGTNTEISDYICNAMEPLGGSGIQTLSIGISEGGGDVGDTGQLTVQGDIDSLSGLGFMNALLPDSLTSTIDFRLEQDATSWSTIGLGAVTCP